MLVISDAAQLKLAAIFSYRQGCHMHKTILTMTNRYELGLTHFLRQRVTLKL